MNMQLHLQTVPVRNGRLWIRHGFKVFQRQPLALSSLFGLFLFAGFVALLIPGLGLPLTMAMLPLLSLGFMLATHLVLQKKTPTAAVFVAPLKLTPERRRSQLLLCLGYAAAMLVVGFLADWVDDGSTRELQKLMESADKADADAIANAASDPRLFWGMATRMGLMGLLSVPYWHAPALVHWGGQGVAQALFSSTLALWRNKGAFALNTFLWGALLLTVASAVSLVFGLLGLQQLAPFVLMTAGLLLSTVFYASLYFSFVDCFMFGAPQSVVDQSA
ncbi:BPSS1780 family membrane protein [Roseateles sp. BYS87W]|uniref:BPSS1780 family membrane protein n=1 Tax=Pelomonas baiyunensis TaxID=3299026 RepID=A0ABW7GUX0_9BURK